MDGRLGNEEEGKRVHGVGDRMVCSVAKATKGATILFFLETQKIIGIGVRWVDVK